MPRKQAAPSDLRHCSEPRSGDYTLQLLPPLQVQQPLSLPTFDPLMLSAAPTSLASSGTAAAVAFAV
jgi:hypothetical protein